jgi:16S rRNA (guanine527-N7)-methyltransferase
VTFRDHLIACLRRSSVDVPHDDAIAMLQEYFSVLVRWNRIINLTALPIENPTDETFDRLFTEPLAAARSFPTDARRWFDLGSGGGSPAVPLKVVVPDVHLTMVESRERKAAFLREVVRSLDLAADVENRRFEDVSGLEESRNRVDVVTVRAVRPDASMFSAASTLLVPNGRLLMFQSSAQSMSVGSFHLRETVQLVESGRGFLATYSMS